MSDLDKLRRRLERANTVAGSKPFTMTPPRSRKRLPRRGIFRCSTMHGRAACLHAERRHLMLGGPSACRASTIKSGSAALPWPRRSSPGRWPGPYRRPGTGRALPRLLHMLHENRTTVSSKTLISDWHHDHPGFPTRFIVGVSPARFNREVAAGADPKRSPMLIAEAYNPPEHGTCPKRRSAKAA